MCESMGLRRSAPEITRLMMRWVLLPAGGLVVLCKVDTNATAKDLMPISNVGSFFGTPLRIKRNEPKPTKLLSIMVIDELNIGHVPIPRKKICYICVFCVTCKTANINCPQVVLLTSSPPSGRRSASTVMVNRRWPTTSSGRALSLGKAPRPSRATRARPRCPWIGARGRTAPKGQGSAGFPSTIVRVAVLLTFFVRKALWGPTGWGATRPAR